MSYVCCIHASLRLARSVTQVFSGAQLCAVILWKGCIANMAAFSFSHLKALIQTTSTAARPLVLTLTPAKLQLCTVPGSQVNHSTKVNLKSHYKTCTYTHTHRHTDTQTHTHTRTHTRTHTHTHTQIPCISIYYVCGSCKYCCNE